MARIGEFVRWAILPGQPMTVNQLTVTPLARSLTVRWSQGGFIWNVPVTLLVTQNGQTQQLPIPDVTRRAQIILLSIGFIVSLLLWMSSHKEETPL
ncbi:MAG: hypothetical protein NT075_10850 [Chloroflexi bacterium]|nr:hypothetical protein [Chloroflexota bacterium]